MVVRRPIDIAQRLSGVYWAARLERLIGPNLLGNHHIGGYNLLTPLHRDCRCIFGSSAWTAYRA